MLEIYLIISCSLIPISQNLISFAQFAKFRGVGGTGAIGMVHFCETMRGDLEDPGVTVGIGLQNIVIVEERFAICHRNRPQRHPAFGQTQSSGSGVPSAASLKLALTAMGRKRSFLRDSP